MESLDDVINIVNILINEYCDRIYNSINNIVDILDINSKNKIKLINESPLILRDKIRNKKYILNGFYKILDKSIILKNGYNQCKSTPCIYTKRVILSDCSDKFHEFFDIIINYDYFI